MYENVLCTHKAQNSPRVLYYQVQSIKFVNFDLIGLYITAEQ